MRALLGHHSSGTKSVETYSRDILAAPLREFEHVLQQIRTSAFRPDSTRSGLLGAALEPDPQRSYVPEKLDKESEASESSSSSDSESSGEVHNEEQEAASTDLVVQPSQWEPDVQMFQHEKSSIVHVMAKGTANNRFSCGNQLTKDYRKVSEVAFLEFRKCKRCAIARPIKDVGAFAAALKKQRLEREA